MDYQALGLGEAPSVVTAVSVVEDEHAISVSCLYDPQGAQMPYRLCFNKCTHIAWESFAEGVDRHQLDAELIGISLETNGPQKQAVITTDVFELSFSYGSFAVQTHTSTSQVLALNAKRTAPSITQEEAELLLHINDRLPEAIQQRYHELMAKRDAETLGTGEYTELLALTAQAEAFDVRRVEALSKLASRRGVTLTELMRQLGIEPPSDA